VAIRRKYPGASRADSAGVGETVEVEDLVGKVDKIIISQKGQGAIGLGWATTNYG